MAVQVGATSEQSLGRSWDLLCRREASAFSKQSSRPSHGVVKKVVLAAATIVHGFPEYMWDIFVQHTVLIFSACSAHTVSPNVSLVAAACVLIAVKFEDDRDATIERVFRTLKKEYTVNDVLTMEREVLIRLEYALPPTTVEMILAVKPDLNLVRGKGARLRQWMAYEVTQGRRASEVARQGVNQYLDL